MDNNSEIRKKIFDVFPREPVSKIRLSDAAVADHFGDESKSFKEDWKDWTEIQDWQLEKCDGSLFAFYEGKDISYFIPRYMIWVLDEMNKGTEARLHAWWGLRVVSYLANRRKLISYDLYADFDERQKEVIEDFLIHVEGNNEFRDLLD